MINHSKAVSNEYRDAPSVSVVIPLYNKRDTVARALNSVLAQTVQDFEIIAINDGATDGSEEVVAAFADTRIRLFHQANQGASAARNLGIRESRSDWIAFLDADDTWQVDHLEVLFGLRSDYPDADVCATCYLYGVEGEGTRPPVVRGLPANWRGILPDYFAMATRSDPPLWTSAVAVSRKAIEAVGGFPVGVTSGEDLLTWARLAVRGRIAYSMNSSATFWQAAGHSCRSEPTRNHDPDDLVGQGLRSLLLECRPDQQTGLNKYIGLWHKMRAQTHMLFGRRRESLKETWIALGHDPLAWKLYLYVLITPFPAAFQRLIFQWFSR